MRVWQSKWSLQSLRDRKKHQVTLIIPANVPRNSKSGHVTQELEVRQDRSLVEALPVSNEPALERKANRDQDPLILQKKVDLHLHPTRLLHL